MYCIAMIIKDVAITTFRWIHDTIAIFLIIKVLIFVNIWQLIWIPLWFIHERTYSLIESFGYEWGTLLTKCILTIISRGKRRMIFYGKKPKMNNENTFLISNHTCTVDWYMYLVFASKFNAARRLRFFLKRSFKNVPVGGWLVNLHKMCFLEKNYEKDKVTIETYLKDMRDKDIPHWLMLYPEGTFVTMNTRNILEKTQRYARENNLNVYEYVLNPRTKGFEICLNQENRKNFKRVIDLTMAFDGPYNPKLCDSPLPTLLNMFRYPTRDNQFDMHVYVQEFDIDEIGDDTVGWLQNRFAEKNNLLRYFDEYRRFHGDTFKLDDPVKLIYPMSVVSILSEWFITYMFFWLCNTLLPLWWRYVIPLTFIGLFWGFVFLITVMLLVYDWYNQQAVDINTKIINEPHSDIE
jgi:lysocardiolipin and lysophospholipid acyltransferase